MKNNPLQYEFQGHRGARGWMPENTIPGFMKAMDLGVQTFELDLVISKDKKVLVSHDLWINSEICTGVNQEKQGEAKRSIYQMSYEEIKAFDCGSRGNPDFPSQKKIAAHKPLLSELVVELDKYALAQGLSVPVFNLEIKSNPENSHEVQPDPEEFAGLVVAEVLKLEIKERTVASSFDPRILEAIKEKLPDLPLSFLVKNSEPILQNLKKLTFTPDFYSPEYIVIKDDTIQIAHERGMKVIVWTVNDLGEMKRLRKKGVDGIISDFPDLFHELRVDNSDNANVS